LKDLSLWEQDNILFGQLSRVQSHLRIANFVYVYILFFLLFSKLVGVDIIYWHIERSFFCLHFISWEYLDAHFVVFQ
jgi:hypothetical protein